MEIDKEDKSMKELLKEINERLDDKNKKKFNFKIPLAGKIGKAKAKKGWTTAMIIKENNNVVFQRYPIEEQTILVAGIPRVVTPDKVLFYKNKPLVIVPEWSVEAFNAEKEFQKTVAEQKSSHGFKLLLNRMQKEVTKPTRQLGGIWIFVIIAAVIGVGWYAWKSGWFS